RAGRSLRRARGPQPPRRPRQALWRDRGRPEQGRRDHRRLPRAPPGPDRFGTARRDRLAGRGRLDPRRDRAMMLTRRRWREKSEIAQRTSISLYTAMRLYDARITTVAELRAAVASGRIYDVPRLTELEHAAIRRALAALGPSNPPPRAA